MDDNGKTMEEAKIAQVAVCRSQVSLTFRISYSGKHRLNFFID